MIQSSVFRNFVLLSEILMLKREHTDEEIIDKAKSIEKEEITYANWQQREFDGKMKPVCVQVTIKKSEFVEMIYEYITKFCAHLYRVQRQYLDVRDVTKNLKKNEVLMQMDFAENYLCIPDAESQSVHYNRPQESLHPAVVYYKDIGGNLQQKSLYCVSSHL